MEESMEAAKNEALIDNKEALAVIYKAVLELSNHDDLSDIQYADVPILKKATEQFFENVPLTFLLPAFPAKSPSTAKTSGIHPDLGEVLALKSLDEMCKKISSVYAPGARVVICSDGRVFSDVVSVPDAHIDEYGEWIENIIREFKLSHLSTFSMDDLYPDTKGDLLRERLVWRYAKSTDEIRFLVINDDNYRALFNGVHKFMMEDHGGLAENKTLSKNQLSKKTKLLTYELIRRSDAWSELLTDQFGDVLRLSIHAYPINHSKFGVKLLSSSDKWATPWHNVTVKVDGAFQLMHKSKALELGATEKRLGGKYVYFEV
ncbi:pyoverdine biosynthesis protein PvcA [Bacteriovorax stolpii]|uniref:Pyoverdine biosynthesis protein PvcA n=2 Tax=Bacteriovorax stolpii TaxID=960 RepID=A0A2K9NMY0_BACTC|nr:pyoverdine biosynthesis protein PvcA [Bacteriovorax stolpii]QDK43192.1 pyoverdine biosynthesis protein PvcA [Bacteriovorax stolpii]